MLGAQDHRRPLAVGVSESLCPALAIDEVLVERAIELLLTQDIIIEPHLTLFVREKKHKLAVCTQMHFHRV